MLDLQQAKLNLQKFTKDKAKIVPELTDDWLIRYSDMYNSGSWVHIRSEKLRIDIKLCSSDEFLKKNFFYGQKLNILPVEQRTVWGTEFKLIGNYSINKNKVFVSEDEFLLSEDLIEANQA